MDKRLLYQHVSQIGKDGKDWQSYPAVGSAYPVLLDGYISAFEEQKIKQLRNYSAIRSPSKQLRQVIERDRAKNAQDATITATNLTVNHVLYSLKLLTYYYKLNDENYGSINNLVNSVFNVTEGKESVTAHVVEEIIRWLEETLLHRYGLISQITCYDKFSLLDQFGDSVTPGIAGGASRAGSPYKSTFSDHFFNSLFDETFDFVVETLLHEALHRVSYSDFVIRRFALGDHVYHDNKREFGVTDTKEHLRNADSFSNITLKFVELKISPKKRLPYDRPVVLGDTLWDIADEEYGRGSLYWVIWNANKDKLSSGNEDMIFPGETVTIPELPKELQKPQP